jgi:putative acetyltransferase
VIIRSTDWDAPDAELLRNSQRAEIMARYGTADSEPGPAPTAEDVTLFLVAYDDDDVTPIGCGGLRAIDDHHGEIKRMYVVPDRRGTGVAAFVLRSLEKFAANALGWDRLVLETGDQQPDAIRFYEREGYTRIPNFGYYARSTNSLCFEHALARAEGSTSWTLGPWGS